MPRAREPSKPPSHTCMRSYLIPAVSILRETRTLHPYDAKTLAGRRLHHHPTPQPAHYLRTQLLQAHHFRGDIVGLDVYVNATLVVHPLDFHNRLVGRRLQHSVIAAAVRMVGVDSAAERLAPKARGLIHVGGIAVDQHGA